MAIGIHGQWLYINPATRVVIVKLSSQATPLDEQIEARCLDLYAQISAMV